MINHRLLISQIAFRFILSNCDRMWGKMRNNPENPLYGSINARKINFWSSRAACVRVHSLDAKCVQIAFSSEGKRQRRTIRKGAFVVCAHILRQNIC